MFIFDLVSSLNLISSYQSPTCISNKYLKLGFKTELLAFLPDSSQTSFSMVFYISGNDNFIHPSAHPKLSFTFDPFFWYLHAIHSNQHDIFKTKISSYPDLQGLHDLPFPLAFSLYLPHLFLVYSAPIILDPGMFLQHTRYTFISGLSHLLYFLCLDWFSTRYTLLSACLGVYKKGSFLHCLIK